MRIRPGNFHSSKPYHIGWGISQADRFDTIPDHALVAWSSFGLCPHAGRAGRTPEEEQRGRHADFADSERPAECHQLADAPADVSRHAAICQRAAFAAD